MSGASNEYNNHQFIIEMKTGAIDGIYGIGGVSKVFEMLKKRHPWGNWALVKIVDSNFHRDQEIFFSELMHCNVLGSEPTENPPKISQTPFGRIAFYNGFVNCLNALSSDIDDENVKAINDHIKKLDRWVDVGGDMPELVI